MDDLVLFVSMVEFFPIYVRGNIFRNGWNSQFATIKRCKNTSLAMCDREKPSSSLRKKKHYQILFLSMKNQGMYQRVASDSPQRQRKHF
jgi:hypothetical protein